MKKILLSIVMLIAALPLWAHDFEVDGIDYKILDKEAKTVEVYDGVGKVGLAILSSIVTYNDTTYTVTSIGDNAFANSFFTTAIWIPETVTNIGENAFLNCSKITSFTIPESVTTIGSAAFYGCSGLTSINIPGPIEKIENSTFEQCSGLTSIALPTSVKSIGDSAFSSCNSVTEITIPESVTTIGSAAFYGCSSLTSIIIPTYVEKIENSTFEQCSGLTSIALPESVSSIGDSAFSGCNSLTSITIPESVSSIGVSAFSGCNSLTSITIPESVKAIGSSAFSGCSGLTSIIIPTYVEKIENSTFEQCAALTSITIPASVKAIGSAAFSGCNNVLEVNISDITAWCKFDFENSLLKDNGVLKLNGIALTDLDIPEEITEIKPYTFSNCSQLLSVTIPSSVTTIEKEAFYGCSNLISITFGSGVTNIGEKAFCASSGQIEATKAIWLAETPPTNYATNGPTATVNYVPNDQYSELENTSKFSELNTMIEVDGIKYIPRVSLGTALIIDCTYDATASNINIDSLIYNGEALPFSRIMPYTFYNNDFITNCSINCSTITENAFYGCDALSKVVIGESVELIYGSAFSNCSELTAVSFNAIVCDYYRKSEGGYGEVIHSDETPIFKECINLQTVNFGENVTKIPDRLFQNCIGLTSVTITDSVTTIDYGAFSGCTGLANVTLGNSVTAIGGYAFFGCTGLANVTLGNSVTAIGSCAFYGCTSLTSINIPNSVTSIASSAFADTGYFNAQPDGPIYLDNCFFGYNGTISGDIIINEGTRLIVDRAMNFRHDMTSVTIPNSVTNIGEKAFYFCTGLTSINIPNSVTSIGFSAFSDCESLTSAKIGNSVTNIDSYSFSGCSKLTDVIIGSSVSEIGDYAFGGCDSIKSIYCRAVNVPIISYYTFTNHNATVYVPEGTENKYKQYFYWTRFASIEGVYSVEYKVTDEETKTAEVYKGNDYAIDVEISGIWNDYTVNSIAASAFKDCDELVSVTIPETITSIHDEAFQDCSSLISINIPDSVTSIGKNAFLNTRYWNNYTDSLVYLDNCLLGYKTELSDTVVINDGTRLIANYALSNCANLKSITIPDSLATIGYGAFFGCDNLSEIHSNALIPPQATSDFPDYNIVLVVPDEVIDSYMEDEYWGKFKYIIPQSGIFVKIIDEVALSAEVCSGSKSYSGDIKIPERIKRNGKIYTITSIGESAFAYCDNLKSVTIPETVTEIGGLAFYGSSLTSIALPESITTIGYRAFHSCDKLTSITIPDSVNYIGINAFTGCSMLTDIAIGDAVSEIYNETFYDCTSLKTVSIGNLVNYIGSDAFSNCKNIKEVNISDLEAWCNIDFDNSNSNPLYNGAALILNGSAVTDLDIPEAVDEIKPYTFYNCSSLVSVTMSESVSKIEKFAFFNCTGLTSATIGNSVTEIGSGAFSFCRNLTSILIPESVTSIGQLAFASCSGLTSLTIGSSVKSIGEYAFSGCKIISEITSKVVTPPTIYSSTFANYDATLNVPAESVEAYKVADYWKNFMNIFATSGAELIGVDSEPTIEVVNGEIVVNGGADAHIAVYAINGAMIYQGANRPVAVAKGVYIVIVNGKATKVVI